MDGEQQPGIEISVDGDLPHLRTGVLTNETFGLWNPV